MESKASTNQTSTSSLSQLVAERNRLDEQISLVRKGEQSEALKQVRTLMNDFGLTIADISLSKRQASGSPKMRTAVPVKFRHPTTGEGWSGRGLQPRWLKAFIAEGRTLEETRVN